MEHREVHTTPQTYARIGGLLYLIIIVIGFLGEVFVRGTLIVPGDPAATAANIRASDLLWRLSLTGELLMLTCAVALALIFYVLLRPVHRDLALLVTLFNMVSITLEAGNKSHLIATLFPLGNADYLRAFEPAQLEALAYHATRSHQHGFGVNLIFFGVECILIGFLIVRSGYLPKLLGLLMQLAGVCYLVNSTTLLVAPALNSQLAPAVLLPVFVGETSLALWLLVKGVNVERWQQRASRSQDVPTQSGLRLGARPASGG